MGSSSSRSTRARCSSPRDVRGRMARKAAGPVHLPALATSLEVDDWVTPWAASMTKRDRSSQDHTTLEQLMRPVSSKLDEATRSSWLMLHGSLPCLLSSLVRGRGLRGPGYHQLLVQLLPCEYTSLAARRGCTVQEVLLCTIQFPAGWSGRDTLVAFIVWSTGSIHWHCTPA